MADPISAASAIITLVTFGIKSSSTLCQTFKEFNSHHKYVRELKAELDALSLVLASLHQAILDNEADFTLLKLPLFRCGSACIEFNMVVKDATKQSHGSLASFRDWAKLKYMGDDIEGFKERLAYTSSQLRIHLTDVLRRLDAFQRQTFVHPDSNEQDKMREEINSIKQSLAVCAKASEEASAERVNMFDEVSLGEDGHQVIVSTVGDLINARRVSAGARSTQLLGQMSDSTLQTIGQRQSHIFSKQRPLQQEDDALSSGD